MRANFGAKIIHKKHFTNLWGVLNEYDEWLLTVDVSSPDFKAKTLVHDWRNYVPDRWQDNWGELTERERKIIAIMAQAQADSEEWD